MPSLEDIALKISGVKKVFPGIFRPVLQDIDLILHPGDFCVLIGTNGSGKSTLMKILSGSLKADGGTLICNGSIAQVVQDIHRGTIPEMTLLENMVLGQLGLKSKPRLSFYQKRRGQIFQELKKLGIGLEKYLDQSLETLSGGQRQAVATLMALYSKANILLLDEFTSALDPKMATLLMEYTAREITKNNITTLMVTHKMEEALRYGNRLIMLWEGRIVMDRSGLSKKNLTKEELIEFFQTYNQQDPHPMTSKKTQ